MHRQCFRAAIWLAVFALGLASPLASAVPKAAEHGDAPVTYGADVPRPKAGQAAKKAEPKKKAHGKTTARAAKSKHGAASAAHAKPATQKKRRK